MGLPIDFDDAVDAIHEAHGIIEGGGLVEVGCQGGIGRTGTVIACWAILDGVKPKDAVPWVREQYLVRAVETPAQEWWVEWFGAHVHGTTPPTEPRR
jgi:protein-tyrosine phosphatase